MLMPSVTNKSIMENVVAPSFQAYFAAESVKSFITSSSGPNVIKLFCL